MKISVVKWLVLFVLMIGLFGCDSGPDRTATVRFKTIIALKVDGNTREFSSVMQVKYTRITKSLMGAGGGATLWGEAVVIDLGRRGKAYMLVSTRSHNGNFSSSYHTAISQSFGINKSLGSLKQKDIEAYRNLTGRVPMINNDLYNNRPKTKYPMIVAFKDENDPASLFVVDLKDMSPAFGRGVKFENVYLEITDEEITTGEVFKHLPWLKKKYKAGFETEPARTQTSKRIPRSERPIKWRINYNAFFAEESR
ncbi:MAG: hypothetical protein GY748_10005 [Planctomycetaceae bacterium]|nr:hypothetical protein [Planctomycetaceae bacterium]